MEFDEAVLKLAYGFCIGLIFSTLLVFFAIGIFELFHYLRPCLSTCRKALRRRSQGDQGNELNTLPTRPLPNDTGPSSITDAPSEQ